MALKRSCLTAACCLLLTGLVLAQATPLPPVSGATNLDWFSWCLDEVGDVNGDGVSDFAAGTYMGHLSVAYEGYVTVVSGADSSIIHFIPGSAQGDRSGHSVAGIGDVNSDGVPDIAIGAIGTGADPGRVRVHSGADASVIHDIVGSNSGGRFGFTVSKIGDINNDGIPDVLVAEPGMIFPFSPAPPPRVHVLSGATGALLHTVILPIGAGHEVAGIGDVNEDGSADFAIGFPQGAGSAGQVDVYSGADASLLYQVNGVSPFGRVGESIEPAGDVDRDGIGDFIAGGQGLNSLGSPLPSPGAVIVCSGATGQILFSFVSPTNEAGFGTSVDGGRDVNGDGYPDFLIGDSLINTTGSVHLYSGRDGSLIQTIPGTGLHQAMGWNVSFTDDLNMDGFADFLVGSRNEPTLIPMAFGSVAPFLSPTLPTLSFDPTPAGTDLFLEWQPQGGVPTATTGALKCKGASPAAFGLFGVSLAPADLPTVFGIQLLIANDAINLLATGFFGFDNSGEFLEANVSLSLPQLAGSHLFAQFFEYSPVFRSSNGLRMLVSP